MRALWRGAECAGGLGPSKQRLAIVDVGDDGTSDDAEDGVDGDENADDGGGDGDGDGAAGGGEYRAGDDGDYDEPCGW